MLDPFARYALVADDNPLIRMDAQAILRQAGFRVFTAACFEDAMEILALRGHGIRLLFTDVQMPPGTMTGCDLALRCARGWPEIAIIVTSGATPPKFGDLPEGALFISKPFSEETVRRCVRQLLKEQPDED